MLDSAIVRRSVCIGVGLFLLTGGKCILRGTAGKNGYNQEFIDGGSL
jgi:hypothetical protein